ncbi:unnamed protein product, partial [Gadus morhua 'NCC']
VDGHGVGEWQGKSTAMLAYTPFSRDIAQLRVLRSKRFVLSHTSSKSFDILKATACMMLMPQISVIPENMDPGICWLDFSDWRLGLGVVGMRAGGFGGVTDFWIL